MLISRLPEELKNRVVWGTGPGKPSRHLDAKLTLEKAKELAKLPSEKLQLELAERMERRGLTVQQIKRVCRFASKI